METKLQAKKTIYMRKWRKENAQEYRDYQREYKRAYRAKQKASNEK